MWVTGRPPAPASLHRSNPHGHDVVDAHRLVRQQGLAERRFDGGVIAIGEGAVVADAEPHALELVRCVCFSDADLAVYRRALEQGGD